MRLIHLICVVVTPVFVAVGGAHDETTALLAEMKASMARVQADADRIVQAARVVEVAERPSVVLAAEPSRTVLYGQDVATGTTYSGILNRPSGYFSVQSSTGAEVSGAVQTAPVTGTTRVVFDVFTPRK